MASLKRLNPAFVPGASRKAFIFEVDAGEEYLRRHLYREVYFIEYGSKRVNLEHTALVPKGRTAVKFFEHAATQQYCWA